MRLKRSKKANMDMIVVLSITIVGALLLLALGYKWLISSKSAEDDEQCSLSIFANAQIAKARQGTMGVLDAPVAYQCPRKFLKIKFSDVEKYDRIDDDKLKSIIGKEMKNCWSKVGAGKLDPFKRSTTVDEKFCLVCSYVTVDRELDEQIISENYQLKGLQFWLAGHKMPGIKTTLYEYFTGKKPTEEMLRDLKRTEESPESAINLRQKNVVIWRVEKYEEGAWEEAGETVGLALLSTVCLPCGAVIAVAAVVESVVDDGSWVAGGAALLGLPGAIIGLALVDETDTSQITQSVYIMPESRISEKFDFKGDGKKTDFCTQMLN